MELENVYLLLSINSFHGSLNFSFPSGLDAPNSSVFKSVTPQLAGDCCILQNLSPTMANARFNVSTLLNPDAYVHKL
jgi:hypothetical protein